MERFERRLVDPIAGRRGAENGNRPGAAVVSHVPERGHPAESRADEMNLPNVRLREDRFEVGREPIDGVGATTLGIVGASGRIDERPVGARKCRRLPAPHPRPEAQIRDESDSRPVFAPGQFVSKRRSVSRDRRHTRVISPAIDSIGSVRVRRFGSWPPLDDPVHGRRSIIWCDRIDMTSSSV
jgi:hypothetical protein